MEGPDYHPDMPYDEVVNRMRSDSRFATQVMKHEMGTHLGIKAAAHSPDDSWKIDKAIETGRTSQFRGGTFHPDRLHHVAADAIIQTVRENHPDLHKIVLNPDFRWSLREEAAKRITDQSYIEDMVEKMDDTPYDSRGSSATHTGLRRQLVAQSNDPEYLTRRLFRPGNHSLDTMSILNRLTGSIMSPEPPYRLSPYLEHPYKTRESVEKLAKGVLLDPPSKSNRFLISHLGDMAWTDKYWTGMNRDEAPVALHYPQGETTTADLAVSGYNWLTHDEFARYAGLPDSHRLEQNEQRTNWDHAPNTGPIQSHYYYNHAIWHLEKPEHLAMVLANVPPQYHDSVLDHGFVRRAAEEYTRVVPPHVQHGIKFYHPSHGPHQVKGLMDDPIAGPAIARTTWNNDVIGDALEHPNPAVRHAIVRNPRADLSLDELAVLAGDENPDVKQAATGRIIHMMGSGQ